MSFSKDVKNEICHNDIELSCKRSFISAIIKTNANLVINNSGLGLSISFENISITRTIFKMIKELYQVDIQIMVTKQMKLKKLDMYTLKISQDALKILEDLKLLENFNFTSKINKDIVDDEDKKRSYLSGVFVSIGSVNSPETSNYHLEIQSTDEVYLKNLLKLLKTLHLNFKIAQRRKSTVLYLKASSEIVDFLYYLNATQSAFKFEDLRIERDYLNNINRLTNIDVANEMKVQKAANQQIEYIKTIEEYYGLDKLEVKIKRIAKLRVENPEASLVELTEIYNDQFPDKISKSGMNHRFRKIKEIALKINIRGDEYE